MLMPTDVIIFPSNFPKKVSDPNAGMFADAVRGDRQLQRVPAGGGRAVRAGGGPLHRQARAPAAGDR